MSSIHPLTVTFTSDWHIGSGTARHDSLDRIVQRDQNGMPYAPGKTLRGQLREACLDAAVALDNGSKTGPWVSLHNSLFGSPGVDGHINVTSAFLHPDLVASLREAPEFVDALTFPRSSTAVDSRGRAVKDTLRTEERARLGATLHGQITLPDEYDDWSVKLLLTAGSRLLTHMGGKRRRGAGRCRVAIDDLGELSDHVKRAKDSDPNISSNTTSVSTETFVPQGEWRHHRLVLTTLERVMIVDQVLGNVVSGQSFVPGTYLLRLLTETYGTELRDAVKNDRISISHATPSTGGPARALPTPNSLHHRKLRNEEDLEVIDSLMIEFVKNPSGGSPTIEQTVSVRGYVTSGDTAVRRVTDLPVTSAKTHVSTTRDDNLNVTSTPFTYQSIEPGAVFSADIWWQGGPQDLQALAGKHRIGTSRATEYGLVEIEVDPAGQAHPDPGDVGAGEELVVWLTSDLLLPSQQPTAKAFVQHLAQLLDADLQPATTGIGWAAMSTGRRDGWHSGWGLPRPSAMVIAEGSVFRLITDQPISGSRLAEIQRVGLGVRRAEGYGAVVFNPSWLASPTPFDLETTPAVNKPVVHAAPELSAEERSWAKAIRALAIGQIIRRHSVTIAANDDLRRRLVPSWPGNTQIGLLRKALEEIDISKESKQAPAALTELFGLKLRAKENRPEPKKDWQGWNLEACGSLVKNPHNIGIRGNKQTGPRGVAVEAWAQICAAHDIAIKPPADDAPDPDRELRSHLGWRLLRAVWLEAIAYERNMQKTGGDR